MEAKKGTMITACSQNHRITRNSSYFKVIPKPNVTEVSKFQGKERNMDLDQFDDDFPIVNTPQPDPPEQAPQQPRRNPDRNHRVPLRY